MGDELHYGIRFGYVDALVRARFTEFLDEAQYAQLKQAESLEDVKLHLGNFGFQEFAASEAAHVTPTAIFERCLQRMVQRFAEIECQAEDELKDFFQWIRVPFMIDNIVLLISGLVRHREVGDLIERCHPLGMFEGLGALAVVNTVEELYQHILVDSPVGSLFQKCVNRQTLSETNVEIIRLVLYREYFDQFHAFCQSVGGRTAETMREVLMFEADRRAIMITLNSFNAALIVDDKETLYPRVGMLYPQATFLLARAQNDSDVARILDGYEVYRGLWARVSGRKGIEDVFYERSATANAELFCHFFQFGVFYAWVQLMDQEVRNIQWIAECIHQGRREEAESYVRIRK